MAPGLRMVMKMKLLIVDNNPQMRQLLRAVATEVAGEVAECSDGEEAVTTYAAQQPDWALMDLQMARVGLR